MLARANPLRAASHEPCNVAFFVLVTCRVVPCHMKYLTNPTEYLMGHVILIL